MGAERDRDRKVKKDGRERERRNEKGFAIRVIDGGNKEAKRGVI